MWVRRRVAVLVTLLILLCGLLVWSELRWKPDGSSYRVTRSKKGVYLWTELPQAPPDQDALLVGTVEGSRDSSAQALPLAAGGGGKRLVRSIEIAMETRGWKDFIQSWKHALKHRTKDYRSLWNIDAELDSSECKVSLNTRLVHGDDEVVVNAAGDVVSEIAY